MVEGQVRFSIFFPVGEAIKRKDAVVVGNVQIPPSLAKFPLFRTGILDPATKKVNQWWIWDGQRSERVNQLTPAQRSLSIRGIWNLAMLMKRLEDGWTPETDTT